MPNAQREPSTFHLLETSCAGIQEVYRTGQLSAREIVQLYLNRIDSYDRNGPRINSIITVNPKALEDADDLDRALKASGPVGTLHGVPIILKDQIDARNTPTTLGSVVFKEYYPDRDAFVVEKLKEAGAIILAKATLGEMGRGDTYGSLFGSTKNPYDLDRTVGGSSGGPGASVSANLGAMAIGQEALASIRRPAAWNSIVGMRPTAGLVSRSGVYAGWPGTNASLGPMTRTVEDQAILLDALVGYDPEDPITALGVGRIPGKFVQYLQGDGLKGSRIGVMRQPMGIGSEPESEDFGKVSAVFDRIAGDLEAAGAIVVENVEIPRLTELLAKRAGAGEEDQAWNIYFDRSANPPYASPDEMRNSPEYAKVMGRRPSITRPMGDTAHYENLLAREELMTNLMQTMAAHNLDAIIHKSAEHQPTLISEGVNPPYVNMKGATHLNTFLVYVPSISVPAGFTSDELPVGVTFLGRPYSDANMIKLAYAYEQATQHRRPPSTTPQLHGEP